MEQIRIAKALEEANAINQKLVAYIVDRDAKLEQLHRGILLRDRIALVDRCEHILDIAIEAYLDVLGATEEERKRVYTWRLWVSEHKDQIADAQAAAVEVRLKSRREKIEKEGDK